MKKILAAALLAATSSFASAAGVYAGGAVGYTRADIDCSGTSSCTNSGTGLKAFLGYQFNDTFAAELQYVDLGKPNATIGAVKVDLKSTGFGVRGLASFPLSKEAAGFVALGIQQNKSDASATVGSLSGSTSESSTQPSVAIGVDWTLSGALKLRGELESMRFRGVGNSGSYSVANLSVGLKYSF